MRYQFFFFFWLMVCSLSFPCQDLCLQFSAFRWLQLILFLCKAVGRVLLDLQSNHVNPEKSTKGMGGGEPDTGRCKERWVFWRLHHTSKPCKSSHPLMEKAKIHVHLLCHKWTASADFKPSLCYNASRQTLQRVQNKTSSPRTRLKARGYN